MAFSLSTTEIIIIIGIVILTWALAFRTRIPKGLKLPPGPSGHFLVGNLRDVPSHREWETFSEWHKRYGDLVYLNILGTSLLYVNSAEMAHELFDKRSAIYSDRPVIPMVDLIGMSWVFSLMPYGERWRRHRHAFHQKLNKTMQKEYIPVLLKHSRNLLRQLHDHPNDWESRFRHSIGAIAMEIAYGIEILPENDPYIAGAELAGDLIAAVITPGAFLVNTIHILKHLPEWFPGAGFQKQARIWREKLSKMPPAALEFVKKEVALGKAKPSLAAVLLEEAYRESKNQNISEGDEELIRNLAGIVYGAGVDTLASTLQIFVFAMILNPEIQAVAQKELDTVVGPNRLPSFEDRDQLPYLEALCKEVLRWHPFLITSTPHRLTQDDVVGQYFIPAGTIVFGNAWSILHSETGYGPNPMAFSPERFLRSPDMEDPAAAFGFGRRACPGRPMAENTLFIAIASLLHVFNIILPPGETRPASNAFMSGLFSRPMPFKCNFVPRSAAAEALIKQME